MLMGDEKLIGLLICHKIIQSTATMPDTIQSNTIQLSSFNAFFDS